MPAARRGPRRPAPAVSPATNPILVRRFTLQEVAQRTSVNPRTVQFWADRQLIHCTLDTRHHGRGVHRRFEPIEVQITALLRPISMGTVALGTLEFFARLFRRVLTLQVGMVRGRDYDEGDPEIRRVLLRAAAGTGQNWMAVAFAPEIVHIEPITDEGRGPARLNLEDFFPKGTPPDPAIIVLNLTALLAPLFKR
jgi:hypothetical protein